MKITVIVENLAYATGLKAEHGLCFLIEDGKEKILFDTGQSDLFLHNAARLKIDIGAVTALVCSHGHYDHSGGLSAFCEANQSAPIYVGPGFFVPKRGKGDRSIGAVMPLGFESRFVEVPREREIAPGLFIVGSIPVRDEVDTHFSGLFVESGGSFVEDRMEEEQFLCKIEDGALAIVSGCNHRGITNAVAEAKTRFGLPVRLLLGGFHLKDSEEASAAAILKTLADQDIDKLGACHCTGVEKYPLVRAAFGEKAFYAYAGSVF
jgi:7,8-dihydropterin-6-yl-methyl-4-(beta-D-ribofuranosyl)aminobenzene 5'-phosphate synthase